ncbi:MAG: hypothetical protein IJ087_09275 [Eggerthellaceae bacterium]|nr:hypothetical protein [Eggerthellaceae bacterium]
MGCEKEFSEFRRFIRSNGKIDGIKTRALSDIQVRRYDADFDPATVICDMVDEMMTEYLSSYHEWSNRQKS